MAFPSAALGAALLGCWHLMRQAFVLPADVDSGSLNR